MSKARSSSAGKIFETIQYAGMWGSYNGEVIDLSDALGHEGAVFAAHLEVCPLCEGKGTTTAHIEHDGGGFTSSEWAEACAEDHDFAEAYLSGDYDRPCPDCKGRNVVPFVNEDNDKEMLALLQRTAEENRQLEVDAAWERANCV